MKSPSGKIRVLRLTLLLIAATALCACVTPGYYGGAGYSGVYDSGYYTPYYGAYYYDAPGYNPVYPGPFYPGPFYQGAYGGYYAPAYRGDVRYQHRGHHWRGRDHFRGGNHFLRGNQVRSHRDPHGTTTHFHHSAGGFHGQSHDMGKSRGHFHHH